MRYLGRDCLYQETVEQLLTIGYPIGYRDHHAKTLRDRPNRRRMGNPQPHPPTRPLQQHHQNTRTSQTLPPAQTHKRHSISVGL